MEINNIKINKKRVLLGTIILVLFMSINFISAFAVSAPYMENKELYLLPGDVKDLTFTLQESGRTSEITTKAIIIEGSEIIRIIDSSNIYPMPVGEKAKVHLRITIPNNAQIGDIYKVTLNFATSNNEKGNFAFGSAIEQRFTVIIGESLEPVPEFAPEEIVAPSDKPFNYNIVIGTIITIIILLAIIYYIKKKKK